MPSNPHICEALLIRCMDFRLHSELGKWIGDAGINIGGYDLLSLAGAGKNIADGNKEIISYLLLQIGVSVNLHKAKTVILFHHSDCGAYAQSYKFSSPKEEKEKQFEDMRTAEKVISEEYPQINVILLWGELQDSKGKKIKFEILPN